MKLPEECDDSEVIEYKDPMCHAYCLIRFRPYFGCWCWNIRMRHDLPDAKGYVAGQPGSISGFSETRELAIEHVKNQIALALQGVPV